MIEQMRDICCEECGKFIIKTNKPNGAAGAEINYKQLGVYEIPFLYGITNGGYFFCSKECYKKWLQARTTTEQRAKGDKDFKKLKQGDGRIKA